MIIRKLDASHDFTFGKGLSNYARDSQAIAENIETRILSWRGDCFFAPDDFVDWKSRLDTGQEDNLRQELKSVILDSFGVVGVLELSVSLGTSRIFNVSYSVTTNLSTVQGTVSQ